MNPSPPLLQATFNTEHTGCEKEEKRKTHEVLGKLKEEVIKRRACGRNSCNEQSRIESALPFLLVCRPQNSQRQEEHRQNEHQLDDDRTDLACGHGITCYIVHYEHGHVYKGILRGMHYSGFSE